MWETRRAGQHGWRRMIGEVDGVSTHRADAFLRGSCENADSDPAGLGWPLKCYVPN